MAKTLTEDLEMIIDNYPKEAPSLDILRGYERALARYKKLLEKGFVKSRGYNLATIEDTHLLNVNFNQPID